MHVIQKFYDEDLKIRVEMAEHLTLILEDREYLGNIFSDESTFYSFEPVNTNTYRIYIYIFEDKSFTQYNHLDMFKFYFYSIIQRKRPTKKIILWKNSSSSHFSKWIGKDDPISGDRIKSETKT